MSNFTEALLIVTALIHAEGQTDRYAFFAATRKLLKRLVVPTGVGRSLQIDTVKAVTHTFVEKLILGALPKEPRPV